MDVSPEFYKKNRESEKEGLNLGELISAVNKCIALLQKCISHIKAISYQTTEYIPPNLIHTLDSSQMVMMGAMIKWKNHSQRMNQFSNSFGTNVNSMQIMEAMEVVV